MLLSLMQMNTISTATCLLSGRSKMKKIFIFLFFALFSTLTFAQVEASKNEGIYKPRFYFDIANYKSDKAGKTKVAVFLAVPYSNIQFIKSANGFEANYYLTVTFFDEDDNIVTERTWKEKVRTPVFNQTISRTSSNLSYKTFDLVPGKYTMGCSIEDNDSRKNFQMKTPIEVLSFNDSVEVSDLILAEKIVRTKSGDKILPNISQIITTRDSTILFFFEVYSDKDREIQIEYSLRDQKKNLVAQKSGTVKLNKGKNVLYQNFEHQNFMLGNYDLLVQLKNKEGKNLKGIGKRFVSKIYGFPSNITDLDKAIEQMVYIASHSELDYIKEAGTYREKLNRFIAFWKKKDPSPNTLENEVLNEYFRRVAYANAHFKSYYEGWKTDMGMIYITLGPPNQVERQPVAIDSKPYEVWLYYDLNKTFIFVDRTNFGDYYLLNPIFGDWYRYRQ